MSDLSPEAIQFADYIAGLDPRERERVWQQARGLALAQTPDEDVGAPPIRSLGEFLDTEIETPPMIVHSNMVARGGVHAMIAKAGKGKTAVSLNRFVRWGMGLPFLPDLQDVLAPEAPTKVLLIENEGSGWHFQQVLSKIIGDRSYTDEERRRARENVMIWGEGGWSGMKLDDPASLQRLRRGCDTFRPDIVFVEPMRGLWKGNENDSGEMAAMIDSLSELANFYECAVMLTHHERKSGTGDGGDPMDAARGSAVLVDLCAVVERWLPAAGGQQRELTWAKSRFGEPPAPIRLKWVPQRWGYEYVADSAVTRTIAAVLSYSPGEWFDIPTLMEDTGESRPKVKKALDELVAEKRAKLVSHQGEGKRFYTWVGDGSGEDDNDTLAVS